MIKNKQKRCKGTGKAKGYGCGEMKIQRTYGLCHDSCYPEWLYSTPKGKEKIEKETIKAKKEVERKRKEETKKQKIKLENWKNKLQKKVQEIARQIDFGLLCLAREIEAKQMHGGHIYSKGGNTEMRFNLHNIHRQSAYSNTYKNDDGLMQEGISREYGQDYLDFIRGLKNNPIPNHSNLDYYSFYKAACSVSNRLKKDLKVLTPKQRIDLRNKINEDIGVYEIEHCVFDHRALNS